jgi:pimeloyl-ACP methyl ester carboxylesterase
MTTIEQKRVAARGAVLATEAWGTDERGTILLAMGATASMVWWPDALMEGLAAGGYRAIRFDHRDTGQSTTNAPGEVTYDVFDLAGDLTAILDAYGVKSAHLVGMSLGAYVSQITALRQPERAASLTLIAAEPLGITYEGEGILAGLMAHFGTMETLDWADRAAVAEFMMGIAELSAGSGRAFDGVAARRRIELELDRTASMQSAFNHAMVGGEIGTLTAADLRLPVLVVHGSEDPVISVAAAKVTAKAVPGARLLLLEGRGHELVAADVPAIVEALLEVTSG